MPLFGRGRLVVFLILHNRIYSKKYDPCRRRIRPKTVHRSLKTFDQHRNELGEISQGSLALAACPTTMDKGGNYNAHLGSISNDQIRASPAAVIALVPDAVNHVSALVLAGFSGELPVVRDLIAQLSLAPIDSLVMADYSWAPLGISRRAIRTPLKPRWPRCKRAQMRGWEAADAV